MTQVLCLRYFVVLTVLAALTACAGAGKGAVQGAAARAMYPEIIRWDRAIDSEPETEATLANVLRELRQIRVEYRLPQTCT